MEQLGALFHWSPLDRRGAIRREGLVVGSENAVAHGRLPYVCLGPTPAAAWGLSGDMDWMSEIDDWDLWQVRLVEGDDIRIRNDFGPRIIEVRVHQTLPPDRLWWAGTRQPWLTDTN